MKAMIRDVTAPAAEEPQDVMRASMIVEVSAPAAPRTAPLSGWLSVERLLYGVALFIGVWLRFWHIGAQPLSPWEASNSWPAWLTANGLQVMNAPTPNSALYYALQWLLFWTGVNNDGGARFISVVAGTFMILSPWWWRGFLGRRVALVLAFLMAVDSWLLGFSRLADGAMLSLALGMLVMVAIYQVTENPLSIDWKRVTAIALGLMIVSGPMGWNILPVVIWFGWLFHEEIAAAGLLQRQWLLWLGAAALAGATLFFARIDGLSWIASGTSVWLAQWDGKSAGPLLPVVTGGYDLWWPLLRFAADAAPLLPLGIGGLVLLILRAGRATTSVNTARRLLTFCGGWLLWGLLLCLLPGRSPLALPILGLPLMILTAYFLDALFTTIPNDADWREVGAVIVTLAILLVSGVFWITELLATHKYDSVTAQASLVVFGLALAILVGFAVWTNRRDAAWVAISIVSVLLLLIYVRSSWKLSFGSVVTEPAGWQATTSNPEIRTFERDIETLSSHTTGDPFEIPVQVQESPYATTNDQVMPARPDPVVGWELRNMRNLTWVTAPLVTKDTKPLPLVVTPSTDANDAQKLDLPKQYAGSKYHIDVSWLPNTLASGQDPKANGQESDVGEQVTETLQPWWRWFVYREASKAPQNRDLILWAPLDLPAQ